LYQYAAFTKSRPASFPSSRYRGKKHGNDILFVGCPPNKRRSVALFQRNANVLDQVPPLIPRVRRLTRRNNRPGIIRCLRQILLNADATL
jgi:hypothetical protein